MSNPFGIPQLEIFEDHITKELRSRNLITAANIIVSLRREVRVLEAELRVKKAQVDKMISDEGWRKNPDQMGR